MIKGASLVRGSMLHNGGPAANLLREFVLLTLRQRRYALTALLEVRRIGFARRIHARSDVLCSTSIVYFFRYWLLIQRKP